MTTATPPNWSVPPPSPPELAYDVILVYSLGGPNKAARIVEVDERVMARWIKSDANLMPASCRQLLRLTALGIYKPPT